MLCTCKFVKFGMEESLIKDPNCPMHHTEFEKISRLIKYHQAILGQIQSIFDAWFTGDYERQAALTNYLFEMTNKARKELMKKNG